jgi:hypothetical protein
MNPVVIIRKHLLEILQHGGWLWVWVEGDPFAGGWFSRDLLMIFPLLLLRGFGSHGCGVSVKGHRAKPQRAGDIRL